MNRPKLLRGSEPEIDLPPSRSFLVERGAVLRWLYYVAIIACIVFMLKGCASPALADEVPQDKAVKVLVGEASNQGFMGMVCVAEVLRRRGSIKGFYGYSAKHSAHEPKWVWEMARKAWLASANTDYTNNADHFENTHAFGCPYWVKRCNKTFQWKDHIFYRENA